MICDVGEERDVLVGIADNANVYKNCNKWGLKKPGVFSYAGGYEDLENNRRDWISYVGSYEDILKKRRDWIGRNGNNNTASLSISISFMSKIVSCVVIFLL